MSQTKRNSWLYALRTVTLIVAGLTAGSASAKVSKTDTLERFKNAVNLINNEKDLNQLSKSMSRLAAQLEKKGDSATAEKMRAAARHDSLAMTRVYLRSELEKKDVNGLYLIFAGENFCATYAHEDGWGDTDPVASTLYCLKDLFLALITLGENNASAKQTL